MSAYYWISLGKVLKNGEGWGKFLAQNVCNILIFLTLLEIQGYSAELFPKLCHDFSEHGAEKVDITTLPLPIPVTTSQNNTKGRIRWRKQNRGETASPSHCRYLHSGSEWNKAMLQPVPMVGSTSEKLLVNLSFLGGNWLNLSPTPSPMSLPRNRMEKVGSSLLHSSRLDPTQWGTDGQGGEQKLKQCGFKSLLGQEN